MLALPVAVRVDRALLREEGLSVETEEADSPTDGTVDCVGSTDTNADADGLLDTNAESEGLADTNAVLDPSPEPVGSADRVTEALLDPVEETVKTDERVSGTDGADTRDGELAALLLGSREAAADRVGVRVPAAVADSIALRLAASVVDPDRVDLLFTVGAAVADSNRLEWADAETLAVPVVLLVTLCEEEPLCVTVTDDDGREVTVTEGEDMGDRVSLTDGDMVGVPDPSRLLFGDPDRDGDCVVDAECVCEPEVVRLTAHERDPDGFDDCDAVPVAAEDGDTVWRIVSVPVVCADGEIVTVEPGDPRGGTVDRADWLGDLDLVADPVVVIVVSIERLAGAVRVCVLDTETDAVPVLLPFVLGECDADAV